MRSTLNPFVESLPSFVRASGGVCAHARLAAGALALAMGPVAAAQCVGDIFPDGRVDGPDLSAMLAYWGPVSGGGASASCDLDRNGLVDGGDLALLLSAWGACPSPTVPSWADVIEGVPDPAVVTDPAMREAIVATGLAWRVRDRATGIEMLLVPPGSFRMGCSSSDPADCPSRELPAHDVTITGAFYLGRYEVTQAQWQATMGDNPSEFRGLSDSPSRPVEMVTFARVVQFMAVTGMRLPSEAEWEYAARAGTTTDFSNGTNDATTLPDLGWYSVNSGGQTRPVGLKQANRLGFHDTHGNVWEWVQDWFDWSFYEVSPPVDPTGPANPTGYRVARGGQWADSVGLLRVSWRSYGVPSDGYSSTGFRAARTP